MINAVETLVTKAKDADKSEDALRFSQAACNVAHAREILMIKPIADKENT